MLITVCNSAHACSTLLLGNLWGLNGRNLEQNIALIKRELENFEYLPEIDDIPLKWTDHSFVVASTLADDRQKGANLTLEKLGFYRSGPSHNNKNDTSIYFWVIPVKDLKNNLKNGK